MHLVTPIFYFFTYFSCEERDKEAVDKLEISRKRVMRGLLRNKTFLYPSLYVIFALVIKVQKFTAILDETGQRNEVNAIWYDFFGGGALEVITF